MEISDGIHTLIGGGFSTFFLAILASDPRWNGQVLLKEIMILPLLCFSLFFLSRRDKGKTICFAAGLCLGAAVLIFPSALFFAFAVFLLFIICESVARLSNIIMLVAGGVGAVVCFFAFDGHADYFLRWMGVFVFEKVYADKTFFPFLADIIRKMFTPVNALILLTVFIAPFLPRREPKEGLGLKVCFVLTLSFLVSFFFMGKVYVHHLLVLSPMLALAAGIGADFIWRSGRYAGKIFVFCIIVFCVCAFGYENYKNYFLNYGSRMNFPYRIAGYLNERNVRGEYVYFTNYHLGHLLTGSKMPSVYIHPSQVFKTNFQRAWEENRGIYPQTEMEKIFLKKPVFVIVERKFPRHASDFQKNFLAGKLKSDYTLAKIIPDLYKKRKDNRRDALIYERKRGY